MVSSPICSEVFLIVLEEMLNGLTWNQVLYQECPRQPAGNKDTGITHSVTGTKRNFQMYCQKKNEFYSHCGFIRDGCKSKL